jgi:hypothetical protein
VATTQVINVDPNLLQQSAESALNAAEQTRIHIEGEFLDDVPNLMTTLKEKGPYGYTKIWELDIKPDGSLRIPIARTYDEIHEGYVELHKHSHTLTWISLVEVRGEWYTFHEGIATGLNKDTGEASGGGVALGLFPVGAGQGITGEMVWPYISPSQIGLGAQRDSEPQQLSDEEKLEVRRQNIEKHDRYVQALRSADVDGILKELSVDAQGAFRDYVEDTGTLVNLDGSDAHRAYYEALFDKFEINSVEMLRRVAQHWYVFAELRTTVTVREGAEAGRTLSFNTAGWFAPGHDGQFLVRIEHGTDLA